MRKIKYLHIGGTTIFFKPLIKLIDENFCSEEHLFILYKAIASEDLKQEKNVIVFNTKLPKSIYFYAEILYYIIFSKKIIFHGLFDLKMLAILYVTPFWGKKAYWVAWGGDLYDRFYKAKSKKAKLVKFLRARVIKRFRHIMTYLHGDYTRAVEWFGCKAEYHECLMYPSNTFKKVNSPRATDDSCLNIMVGNSADPLNNHLEIFENLASNLPSKYRIYSPISYGDRVYKESIANAGKKLFKDNFIAIEHLMSDMDYAKLLKSMDVVIFNHPIQQAMGNTITALGLGNRVYLRKGTSQWELFTNLGIQVYDSANLEDISEINIGVKDQSNRQKTHLYFSEKILIRQLSQIFTSH